MHLHLLIKSLPAGMERPVLRKLGCSESVMSLIGSGVQSQQSFMWQISLDDGRGCKGLHAFMMKDKKCGDLKMEDDGRAQTLEPGGCGSPLLIGSV